MKRQTGNVPAPRDETIRRRIMQHLESSELSARQLSGEIGVPEKEVYEHLEHIRRTVHRSDRTFVILPPECRKCGFVFSDRGRLRRPGRCPRCREESVHEPLFTVKEKSL